VQTNAAIAVPEIYFGFSGLVDIYLKGVYIE